MEPIGHGDGGDGEPGLGTIRATVLAGLPLLVASRDDGGVLALLREACAVAGRAAALQSLRPGFARSTRATSEPGARRIGAKDIPTRRELSGTLFLMGRARPDTAPFGVPGDRFGPGDFDDFDYEGPDPEEVARVGHAFDLTDGLPDLDLDAVLDGGVLHLRYRPEDAMLLTWLAISLEDRAVRRGLVPPVLVLDGIRDLHHLEAAGWEERLACGGSIRLSFLGAPATLDSLPGPLPATEWTRLRGMAATSLAIRSRDDVLYAVGPDGVRVAHVRRPAHAASHVPDGVPGLLLHVDRDGWASLASVETDPGPGARGDLLRRAWLAGPGLFLGRGMAMAPPAGEHAAGGIVAAAEPDAWEAVLDDARPLPALAALLREWTDVDLARACMACEAPLGTHRWARARPGDRRRQFVMAWPGLGALGPERGISDAVDDGRPMVPVVAARLGVTHAVARRLVGVWAGLPKVVARSPVEADDEPNAATHRPPAGDYLRGFPVDRLPRRGAPGEWAALSDILCHVSGLLHVTSMAEDARGLHEPGLERELACTLPGDDWAGRLANMRKALAPRSADLKDQQDLILAAVSWVRRLPGGATADPASVTRMLAGGRSLVGLAEASLAWHADPALRAVTEMSPDASWPVPFGPQAREGGWSVTALSSVRDLYDEGACGPDRNGLDGLDHCVGGYASRCHSGRSLIVSLRHLGADGSARRVSTLELVRSDGGPVCVAGIPHRVSQHRALSNAEPPTEAIVAMEGFLRDLSGGRVDACVPAVAATVDAIGDRDHADAALALLGRWRRVLPRRHARADAATIVSLCLSP